MKYVMATVALALVACGGPKNRPPPSDPVSTTQTTSSVTVYRGEAVEVDNADAPIIATKEADRNLGTRIRAHLARDKALQGVAWNRVAMEVEDQHVTLRGHLPTLADVTEMERAVREVKGVRAVTNEIHANDTH